MSDRPTEHNTAQQQPDAYAEICWLTAHPLRWATFTHGYASGYTAGLADGRRQLEDELAADWARMRDWLRLSRHPQSRDDLARARAATQPALTPDQIRDRAERSWSAVEDRIRGGAA